MINVYAHLETEIAKCVKIDDDKVSIEELKKTVDSSIKVLTYKKSYSSERTGKIAATFVADGIVVECIMYFDRLAENVTSMFAWSKLT